MTEPGEWLLDSAGPIVRWRAVRDLGLESGEIESTFRMMWIQELKETHSG